MEEKKEIELLEGLYQKHTASLMVIYGRRRVGKSRLVEEFASKYQFISFSGLPPEGETTTQGQLEEFRQQFIQETSHDPGKLTDWSQAFYQLAQRCKTGQTVILLDEITWMGNKDPNFLGRLKNVWDREFKKNDRLILVLCGSVSTWIEKNLISSRGFYDRISLKLKLQELQLDEANQFWRKPGGIYSAYEKLKVLAVTGGIPKYLEEVRTNLTSDENIRKLYFSPTGSLFNDYDHIFTSLLEKQSKHYQHIVKALSDGALERRDIMKKINIESSGHLSDCLQELTTAGCCATIKIAGRRQLGLPVD